jgi:hypothetical protein
MSQGPIEFLSGTVVQEVPDTEFGGADGLIQPDNDTILKGDPDASGGHKLSSDSPDRQIVSERADILGRVAGVPLVGREQTTGISTTGEDIVDPVTGRALDGGSIGKASAVGSGELSDLKPA